MPLFGLRKNHGTTSDIVFRILGRAYPKTIAVLQNDLHKEYKLKLSYQAVRKCVLALVALGAVEHTERGYQLSVDWLLKLRSVVDSALMRYRLPSEVSFKSGVDHQIFTGNSLYETDSLWSDLVVNVCRSLPRSTSNSFISINHYPWWLPMNIGHEIEFCRTLKKLGFEITYVFTASGPSSRWAAEFYKDLNVNVITCKTKSIANTHYYNVIGEYVFEVRIPIAQAVQIKKLFDKNRKPENIPSREITRLAEEPAVVQLTIQKNEAFAKGLLQIAGID